MQILTLVSLALSFTAPQLKEVKMPSVSNSFGGQIVFSAKEIPAPSGIPSSYIAKVNQLRLTSIRYGSDNKVRLHYAAFFKNPAMQNRVLLTFVPTISATDRSKLSAGTLIARGDQFAHGSVEVSEKTLGELTYRVEARIAARVVASGTITFQRSK